MRETDLFLLRKSTSRTSTPMVSVFELKLHGVTKGNQNIDYLANTKM